MSAKDVSVANLTLAELKMQLGDAEAPILRAVKKEIHNMDAAAVARTFWGLSTLDVKLLDTEPLLSCC